LLKNVFEAAIATQLVFLRPADMYWPVKYYHQINLSGYPLRSSSDINCHGVVL